MTPPYDPRHGYVPYGAPVQAKPLGGWWVFVLVAGVLLLGGVCILAGAAWLLVGVGRTEVAGAPTPVAPVAPSPPPVVPVAPAPPPRPMAPVASSEGGELQGAGDGLGAVPVGRPRVSMDMSAVEHESGPGVFDPNVVVRQLRLRSSVVRRCHERELARNPGLQGRVVTRFTIQLSGAVSGVSTTENATGSPAVADCVANVVRTLRFNPGPEGGAVTYRFPVVYVVEHAPSPPSVPPAGSTDPSAPDTPSRAEVVAALNAVAPAVRACGSGIGTVPVRMIFAGADGTVSSATVSSSQGHAPSLTACIEQAARTARVPPFRRPSFTVNYPFRL